ncbi:MAG: rhomboid family intramembrane serine protease [Pseudomonadota bacterium]
MSVPRPSASRPWVTAIWLIAVILIVFVADRGLPLERFGLRPRDVGGLVGIVTMPFLHANFAHLLANLTPLCVLLGLLLVSERRPLATVLLITLVGGALTWIFARHGNHIGASGLVFGLAGYLIANGWYTRSLPSIALAVLTAGVYGSTLLTGFIPTAGPVSWDGHLAGFVGGALVARLRRRPG